MKLRIVQHLKLENNIIVQKEFDKECDSFDISMLKFPMGDAVVPSMLLTCFGEYPDAYYGVMGVEDIT